MPDETAPKTPDEAADDVEQFNQGRELLKAGRLEEAIEKFRVAATTGEDRPMEHYALGAALYRKGDLEAAREEFERYLTMSPKENRYARQAKSILPIIERKLAATAPQDAEADALARRYDEAVDAYMRGDLEVAAEGFEAVLEKKPDSRHTHNNLGLTRLAQGDYAAAVEQFERAIEIDPEFLEARNNLGLAWCDYGLQKARAAFEAVLERDGAFFDAIVNLASLAYRAGDMPRSRELWMRAAQLRPDDPQVRRNMDLFR